MGKNKNAFLDEIADYYSNKLAIYGQTPQGVDWNGKDGQFLRFEQLCRIIHADNSGFSINDLGCGYGALLDYLLSSRLNFSYLGVDVSKDMVVSARSRYQSNSNIRFIESNRPDYDADFGVASGIFNVRQSKSDSQWFEYITATLDILYETSRKGFAFNCLTSYSDEEKKRDYLYYANPCELFDLCKRRYSSQVSLLHDYGLYEFTILVRFS